WKLKFQKPLLTKPIRILRIFGFWSMQKENQHLIPKNTHRSTRQTIPFYPIFRCWTYCSTKGRMRWVIWNEPFCPTGISQSEKKRIIHSGQNSPSGEETIYPPTVARTALWSENDFSTVSNESTPNVFEAKIKS